MSKSSKRKITVDLNVKAKDIPKSRPSVFERLGTKASNDYCRHWAQNGTCPYGKNCKYTNTHTLVSPSKQRAAKKDGVDAAKKKGKDDPNKRLHSAVIIKGAPEPEFDAWDQTDLEYADAEALEKRRQELQRQLELQLKMESKQGHKKDKKPKKRDTSSSSSGSSSSTSESTSTSEDTSSASSASSKESRRRKSKKKTKRNSSSSSDPDVRKRKAASKTTVPSKKAVGHVKVIARHRDQSRTKKHSEISSPPRKPVAPKTPPSKTSRSPSPKRRSSTTPPLKNKGATPSKSNVVKQVSKARASHSLERKDRRGTPSPRPPVRRDDQKDKHKEKERDREKELEKEKEKEREKVKEREKERDRNHEKERDKTRNRDRSVTPSNSKKDSRSVKDVQKKKDSPDNSRDRNRVSSPGRSHGSARRREERSPPREDRRPERNREEDRKKDDRRDKDRSLERRKDDKDNRRHDDRDRDRERDPRDRDRDREPKRLTREEREAAREKEREEALARCQERQRERERLKKLAEKEREMHMRNRDRDRDRERGLDRGLDKPTGDKVERLLPLPSERVPPAVRLQELAAERRSDRGTSKTGSDRLDRRDKSVDRGSDRSFSRSGLDRNSDRDRSDRGSDRMERLPPRDRRGIERNERNYDHSVERTYNRDLDRVYDRERDHERDGRRDRDYPPAPRSHDSDRRTLIPEDKGYDSPYDNRSLRDERHYLEPDHERYDDPMGHRIPIDARDYPDDRRARRDAWDDRVDPRDVREREMQHRVYPRDGPAGGLKGREWDKQEYLGGRHEWNERGSQPHEWEPHHDAWDQVERPGVEEEWHAGYDRSMDAWQNEDRRRNWPPEWQERTGPPIRIPQRPMKPMREEPPHMHPMKEELHPDVRRNIKHIEHEIKVEIREPPEPIEEVKKEQLGKRHAVEPPVEAPDPKKPCLADTSGLEDDLSEISDDADEILNREDVEDTGSDFIDSVLTGFSEAARHFEIPQEPQEVSAPPEVSAEPSTSGPVSQPQPPEEVDNKPDVSPPPPSATENITSVVDHHSVDEEGIDQMDFEEISDEELEEEVKVKGLGDALGVDWASLVAESRPRVKAVTSGSARRRWEPYRVLARIGVSVKMAGVELANEIFSEIKTKNDEVESNDQKNETELEEVKKEPQEEADGIKKEACEEEKAETPSVSIKTESVDAPLEGVHPIAAMQVALRGWNSRRKTLFAGAGSFKRALSARRDLEIRRHLCKLPVKDTIGLGDTQPSHDPELFRLAVKIYERTL